MNDTEVNILKIGSSFTQIISTLSISSGSMKPSEQPSNTSQRGTTEMQHKVNRLNKEYLQSNQQQSTKCNNDNR